MLQKIIYWECLDIFQKKVCDGVSFSKVTSLQCSDCNFTIKRTHHRFFLDYVVKTGCIKKTILRKNPVVNKRHNKVVTLLCAALSFIKKTELMDGLLVEMLKVLMYSQVNLIARDFCH